MFCSAISRIVLRSKSGSKLAFLYVSRSLISCSILSREWFDSSNIVASCSLNIICLAFLTGMFFNLLRFFCCTFRWARISSLFLYLIIRFFFNLNGSVIGWFSDSSINFILSSINALRTFLCFQAWTCSFRFSFSSNCFYLYVSLNSTILTTYCFLSRFKYLWRL